MNDGASISEWQKRVFACAKEHGWWDSYTIWDGSIALTVDQTLAKLALITSEVAEAMEEVRTGQPHLDIIDGKPEGIGAELADVVIRVMGLCEGLGIDLEKCLDVKATYNESRPFRHVGKLA